MSTPVLLQVREHFLHRSEHADVRVFFPKGSLAKCHSERNDLPDIDERYCQEVVRICENALVKIYGQREPMGKVYLSMITGIMWFHSAREVPAMRLRL